MYNSTSKPAIHIFGFPPAEFDTGILLYSAGSFSLDKVENADLAFPDFQGFVLVAVLSGNLTIASGEAVEELDASYAIMLHTQSDIPCTVRTQSACEGIFIAFDGSVAGNIVGQFPQSVFSHFELYSEAALLHVMNAIVTDANCKIINGVHQGASRVYTLLCELCHYLEHNTAAQSSKLVGQAIALIRERYAYLYGVEDLAECMGVTKHHLIREFTHHTGTTPGQFLSKTRIENAKFLLSGTDYSLGIIGQLVGYANGNYFCKVFKRQTGINPKDYRRRNTYMQPFAMPKYILDTEP